MLDQIPMEEVNGQMENNIHWKDLITTFKILFWWRYNWKALWISHLKLYVWFVKYANTKHILFFFLNLGRKSSDMYGANNPTPLCYTQGLTLLVLCSDPGVKPPSSQVYWEVYKQQVRARFPLWLQQLLAVRLRGSYLTTLWFHLLAELLWKGKNTWFYQNKFIVDNTNPHPSEMVKVRPQVDVISSGEDISAPIRRSPWHFVASNMEPWPVPSRTHLLVLQPDCQLPLTCSHLSGSHLTCSPLPLPRVMRGQKTGVAGATL